MKHFLLEILGERLSPEQNAWLHDALSTIGNTTDRDKIASLYTAASHKLGKLRLNLDRSERIDVPIDHWATDDAGRALILLSLTDREPQDYAACVQRCYDLGDSREQQSWLRGLAVLPGGELFIETAIDACRTSILSVFEAIACENRYPAAYFPELNFNQMVLKCLFNGIELSRVAGLSHRLNSELTRMATEYAME
ncbi:MAG TPA: EboA domain-containing protein, partial [Terriglobia bacterium]|nr:EboA domain-containing protein [Terriglobia bacterium]